MRFGLVLFLCVLMLAVSRCDDDDWDDDWDNGLVGEGDAVAGNETVAEGNETVVLPASGLVDEFEDLFFGS